MNTRYHLAGGLTDDQLWAIHEGAKRVLAETGLEVHHQRTRDAVQGTAGLSFIGSRVRFDPGLLASTMVPVAQSARATARAGLSSAGDSASASRGDEPVGASQQACTPDPAAPPDEWTIGILSGYPMNIADWRSGTIRPMLTADLVDCNKLLDVLHAKGVKGSSPGVPMDAPLPMRELLCYRLGAEYCRVGGESALSASSVLWQYRMARAAGKDFGFGVYVNDPLVVAGDSWDQLFIMREYVGAGCGVGVSSMPMMSLSGPVSLVGSFVLSVATSWGASLLARAVLGALGGDGPNVGVGFSAWPIDMRTMQMAFGSPEMLFSDRVSHQLRRFYGWDWDWCNGFHSICPCPDQQAAAQRGAYGMAAALAGNRHFGWGGLLAQDMVFSPTQLLLDVEMVSYYRSMCRGFEFNEGSEGSDGAARHGDGRCKGTIAQAVDAINQVGPGGSFLSLDSTLETYRDHLWVPRLFSGESLGGWQAKGCIDFAARASAEVDSLIAAHEYRLADDVARELDAIMAEAERALL